MAMPIGADYEVRPSELAEVLETMISLRQPLMIWGGPGLAKSALAAQVTAMLGMTYIDVRALLRNPVDIAGFPWRDAGENRMHWAPPEYLPPSDSKDGYVINLEELPAAPPLVQAALYQLVLDRKVGEYELPEKASIIACGNRVSDRGVAHQMATPLASRFVHVTIKPDVDDWCAWAASAGVASAIIFFMQMRGEELLYKFPDPASEEKAFPCPRTWEFASRVIGDDPGKPVMSPHIERNVLIGTVGTAAALELLAFLQVMRDLPHPAEIVRNPSTAPIPGDPSTLLALCGSLYRIADKKNLGAICTFAARLRADVAKFLVSQCVRRDRNLQHTSAFIDWTTNEAA